MKNKIIMANWKMNGDFASIKILCGEIKPSLINTKNLEVAVFPPFAYLDYTNKIIGDKFSIGAQNISQYKNGAYTGEISASMACDLGCKYVIIGHSERRSIFKEQNEVLLEKTKTAISAGLDVVFCVGETLEHRNNNEVEKILSLQVDFLFKSLPKDAIKRIILAYEPVWAIGTGLVASTLQIQNVHAFLRTKVASYCSETASNFKIIYGGSVNSENTKDIMSLADVDGALIGGASLKGAEFNKIIKQVNDLWIS